MEREAAVRRQKRFETRDPAARLRHAASGRTWTTAPHGDQTPSPAQTGLVSASLRIEKLKIELARLRRETYGTLSEKPARIEQLELKLENLEETVAVAICRCSPDRRKSESVIKLGELVMIPDLHRQGRSVSAIAR